MILYRQFNMTKTFGERQQVLGQEAFREALVNERGIGKATTDGKPGRVLSHVVKMMCADARGLFHAGLESLSTGDFGPVIGATLLVAHDLCIGIPLTSVSVMEASRRKLR